MTAPVPVQTATPQPPRTAHPQTPVSSAGRSAAGPDAAAEVGLLVVEIRHLRARLESLETVLAHAVIPAVARVAAVPPPDADADAPTRVPPTPNPGDRTSVTTTASRTRLNRRPRLFPLPDDRPSRPRPPLPG